LKIHGCIYKKADEISICFLSFKTIITIKGTLIPFFCNEFPFTTRATLDDKRFSRRQPFPVTKRTFWISALTLEPNIMFEACICIMSFVIDNGGEFKIFLIRVFFETCTFGCHKNVLLSIILSLYQTKMNKKTTLVVFLNFMIKIIIAFNSHFRKL